MDEEVKHGVHNEFHKTFIFSEQFERSFRVNRIVAE